MRRTAIIVDDHPICRHATAMALHSVDPDILIVEAETIAQARLNAAGAAIVTLDLALPDNKGVFGLPEFRANFPDVPLLVISGATNPSVERQVAAAGAQGYLSKAARISEMVDAIRAVLAGKRWFSPDTTVDDGDDGEFALIASLTSAQARVLRAMESGRLNKQIAHDLGVSEITVKTHVGAILKKLLVSNRTQAVLMLRRVEA